MNASRTGTAAAMLVVGAFLCSLLTAQTQTTGAGARPRSIVPSEACVNALALEPLLVYNLSGGALAGPVHMSLIVYSNGLATMSKKDFSAPDGVVDSKHVSPATVQNLSAALFMAGAQATCDQTEGPVIMDVPLATLTVFPSPGTDAVAHTFSYWAVPGTAVESTLQNFLAVEFQAY